MTEQAGNRLEIIKSTVNFTPREKSVKSLTLFTKLELKINSHNGALKILKRQNTHQFPSS